MGNNKSTSISPSDEGFGLPSHSIDISSWRTEGQNEGIQNVLMLDSPINGSLVEDVARGDVDSLRRKLGGKIPCDESSEGRWTPLHEAAAEGQLECAQVLLQHGAKVNSTNALGYTPLHLAAARGYHQLVEELIERGAEVTYKNSRGETALLLAARNNMAACIESLLSHHSDVSMVDQDGYSVLHHVARQKQTGLVKRILWRGASVNVKTKDTGDSPLHLAVTSGDQEMVKILLQAGAKIDLKNKSGHNSLHNAVACGHLEILGLFASKLNLADTSDNLLHVAAQNGHLRVVKALIKWGMPVNRKDHLVNTPLHMAARNNHIKVATVLVAKGADVNARNASGKRPHDIALDEGYLTLAKCLSDPRGIIVRKVPHTMPRSNLHRAVKEQDMPELLKFLSDGADVNKQDNEGNTALHMSAQTGNHVMASFLLKRHANPLLSNNSGNLAMHLAAINGRHEIVHLLLREKNGHVQINFHNDEGSTPLHFAILGIANGFDLSGHSLENMLSSSERVLINTRSWKGVTPLQLAKFRKCQRAVDILEGYISKDDMNLFKALYYKREDTFFSLVTIQEDLNTNDDHYTLMQLSSLLGLEKCVEILLQLGADPNATCDGCPLPPVLLAASWGYHDVIDVLLKFPAVQFDVTTTGGSNILHILSRGFNNRVQTDYSPFGQVNLNLWNQDYNLCIQKLLKKLKRRGNYPFYINDTDEEGHTPLHFAVMYCNKSTVVQMLLSGADPWIKDKEKFRAIDEMEKATVSEYLDSCVWKDTHRCGKEHQRVVITYDLLRPSNAEAEWTRLKYFENNFSKRRLLKHPVFTTFLHLKWKCVSPFVYWNILIYGVFVALFTINHILLALYYNYYFFEETMAPFLNYIYHISKNIFYVIRATLVLREVMQLLSSLKEYICSLENYLELVILLISFLSDYISLPHNLLLLEMFLIWIEFVLLIGRLPILAKYIAIFLAVIKNYLHFLAVFLSLLIGFFVTFFISCDPFHQEKNCKPVLKNMSTSVSQMMVMMLGEIGFDDLHIGDMSIVPNILFILFLFLVVLVFMNLLNALAVSDTQEIMSEGELYSQRSFVKLVCYVETFFSLKPVTSGTLYKCFGLIGCSWVVKWLCSCCICRLHFYIWQRLRDRVTIFPKIPQGYIVVDLRNGKVLNKNGWQLPKDNIRLLQALLEKKGKENNERERKEKSKAKERNEREKAERRKEKERKQQINQDLVTTELIGLKKALKELQEKVESLDRKSLISSNTN